MRRTKHIVASWSGGIDSTALIARMLVEASHLGIQSMQVVSLDMYQRCAPAMVAREKRARALIEPELFDLACKNKVAVDFVTEDIGWIWKFSPDGKEIPRRNRYLIDYMICKFGARELALGEYEGAETWVVQDHVGAADADARALASYLYLEWGLEYKLWHLSLFDEARFKHQRFALGFTVLGSEMFNTTNCMSNTSLHCGRCYKCLERHAAINLYLDPGEDPTIYIKDPKEHEGYEEYVSQMKGEGGSANWKEFANV